MPRTPPRQVCTTETDSLRNRRTITPNKRNSRNNDSGSRESRPPISDTHEQSSGIAIDDSLVLHLIEALKDDRVMRALHTDSDKLHDKIDSLTVLVTNLTTQLENKEQRITELEKTVALLEVSIDDQQQYSRRANLRFTGIEENAGEDTTKKVLQILNETMQLEPPISLDQIERSHRLGRVTPDQRRPRTLIVRFRSERSRDTVYKARGQLKEFNHRSDPVKRIFVNEDLTSRRANIAFETRKLKKEKKIADCWTFNGRILIKSNRGQIEEISSLGDMDHLRL